MRLFPACQTCEISLLAFFLANANWPCSGTGKPGVQAPPGRSSSRVDVLYGSLPIGEESTNMRPGLLLSYVVCNFAHLSFSRAGKIVSSRSCRRRSLAFRLSGDGRAETRWPMLALTAESHAEVVVLVPGKAGIHACSSHKPQRQFLWYRRHYATMVVCSCGGDASSRGRSHPGR